MGIATLTELTGVADRLVVDSSEWRHLPGVYEQLSGLFDRIAVSDIAFSRTLGWRARLAEHGPRSRRWRKLRVEGPKADALLLAGWLRSRLKRDIALSWRNAKAVQAVRVDGHAIPAPIGALAGGSDLLSAELDVFGRDPVYEAAVRATPRA